MSFLVDQQEVIAVSTPPAVNPAQERVLFAFHEMDRAQFFPAYRDFSPGKGQRSWVDTITLKSQDHWVNYLEETQPTVLVSCWSTPPLPPSLLEKDSFPLRYVCHTTGTVKSKVPREFLTKGGLVTNWGNVISHNVAEHALLLILASLRNINSWRKQVVAPYDGYGNAFKLKTASLRGKKVGIHGIGNVAGELIKLLQPFDVECRSFSQGVPSSYIREKGCIPCASLEELFRESEVVVECEALTPQSTGSVREEHFRLMPEGSVFVNVGRGAVVDEKALARVAAEGHIQVALDVFEREPLLPDSPLLTIENAVLSPHIAGPTNDWFHRCGDYAMENVDRYLAGQSLNGLVTLEIYDRTT
jgi:phosphoglycerate dehydrogenase-like enzyme